MGGVQGGEGHRSAGFQVVEEIRPEEAEEDAGRARAGRHCPPPPPGREKAAGARSGVGCGDREAPALREERLRLREGGETGRVVSAAPPAPVRQPPYGPAPLAFLLRAGTAHPRPRAAPGFIPVTLTSGLKHQNAEMEPGKGVSRAAL